jgi:LexA-binding, inner membrane-associated putative hydrolase
VRCLAGQDRGPQDASLGTTRAAPLCFDARVPNRLLVYTDPLQHALIAAAVVAPLVPRARGRVLATAVTAAIAIDVDHAIAARSWRIGALTSLPRRPPSHSMLAAAGTGAVVAAAAGPLHGWAAFSGLASHLLHDAGDRSAPTPLLWPFAPARQLGRGAQLVMTAALALGSLAVSRATAAASRAPSAPGAGGDGAAARSRTV